MPGPSASPDLDAHAACARRDWPAIVGVVAAVTMTLGNFTALHQNNLKRLLAYSSISHAGDALMGLTAASVLGVQSVMIHCWSTW